MAERRRSYHLASRSSSMSETTTGNNFGGLVAFRRHGHSLHFVTALVARLGSEVFTSSISLEREFSHFSRQFLQKIKQKLVQRIRLYKNKKEKKVNLRRTWLSCRECAAAGHAPCPCLGPCAIRNGQRPLRHGGVDERRERVVVVAE